MALKTSALAPGGGDGLRAVDDRRPAAGDGCGRVRVSICLLTLLAAGAAASGAPLTMSQLLAQGWEIAGFASGYDNRTSLILLRHAGINELVQCGVLHDVTRDPHTIINCY